MTCKRSQVRVLYFPSGGVAQLVSAPACQAGGREFNPRRSRADIRNMRNMFLIFFIMTSPLIFSQEASYTVQSGDTLFSLSRKFNVPITSLKGINHMDQGTMIHSGLKLIIPQIYKVKSGDTLYSLARRFGVANRDLQVWNELKDNTLRVGQTLYTPPIKEIPVVSIPPVISKIEEKQDFLYPLEGGGRITEQPVKGVLYTPRTGSFISACDGTVIFVGTYREWGNLLLIENSKGEVFGYSRYDKNLVNLGALVKKGQRLGELDQKGEDFLFFSYKEGKSVVLNPANPKIL